MSKKLELKVMTGELAGRIFSVPDGGLRLGRSSSNDIHIVDEELSRNHCIFEPEGELGIRVIDLASANGTFVNGTQLASAPQSLKAGDRIEVGATLISVVGDAPAPAAVVAERPPEPGVVDLGLGAGTQSAAEQAPREPVPQGRKVANLLWTGVVTALVVAIFLILTNESSPSPRGKSEKTTETPSARTRKGTEAKAPAERAYLLYEHVAATAEKVSRYCVTLDGTRASLVFDSMTAELGDGQKVEETGKLSDWSVKELDSIFDSAEWLGLDSSFGQSASSVNQLNSWRIKVVRYGKVKDVRVENTTRDKAFSEICDRLETLFNNDLGVQTSLRSPEECLKASKKSEEFGDELFEKREVKEDNLWNAIKCFRQARAELKGLAAYYEEQNRLAEKLENAQNILRQQYDEVRLRAENAKKIEDWEAALAAYREIRAMIPSTSDSRGAEAESNLRDIEGRLASQKEKRK